MRFIGILEDINSENFFLDQIVNIELCKPCELYGVDIKSLLHLFSLVKGKEDINQALFSYLNANLCVTSCLK